MRIYVMSLGAGLLVGIIYGLLNVRSPAPPVIALVGLLGILLDEQVVPVAKRVFAGHGLVSAWKGEACDRHVFGQLPGRKST